MWNRQWKWKCYAFELKKKQQQSKDDIAKVLQWLTVFGGIFLRRSNWRGVTVQVMESEEFMLLPANQLIDIISSDELNVRSEEQVFNAVMAWVKYSIQERRPQLPQVCVHLGIRLPSQLFLLLRSNCTWGKCVISKQLKPETSENCVS